MRWLVTDLFRVEVAAECMEWSRWDERTVKTDDPLLGPSFTSKLDWTNSWILMTGLEYDLTKRWTVRTGYSFNQTPVRGSRAQVDIPSGDVHVLALGVGYHLTESLSVDAATNLAYGEARTLEHSSAPAGTDFDAISTYFSLGVRYRF